MIPNTEIRTIYKRTILTWFDKRVKSLERSELIFALEKGDCEKIETFISTQLYLPRWHKLDSGGQAACISLGLSVK